MWAHLRNQCKKYPYRIKDKKQKTLSFKPKQEFGEWDRSLVIRNVKAVTYNHDICMKELTAMIITDELVFRFIKGISLGDSIFVQPKFFVPSHFTIARDCMKLFLKKKDKLKTCLKNKRIFLTIDTWTLIQKMITFVSQVIRLTKNV